MTSFHVCTVEPVVTYTKCTSCCQQCGIPLFLVHQSATHPSANPHSRSVQLTSLHLRSAELVGASDKLNQQVPTLSRDLVKYATSFTCMLLGRPCSHSHWSPNSLKRKKIKKYQKHNKKYKCTKGTSVLIEKSSF